MNLYVIRNEDERAYVSTPGSRFTFTGKLENAQTFNSYESAKGECCGNETPVSVESLLTTPKG